ncbi:carbohydrate binding domain-containing protein, partial [Patescibacteria group bacterium]|nr:carbohydrate binding domain-containing protein [Patescibacteria group bacterium]
MKLFQSKTRKLFAGFFAFGLTLSIVSAGIFSLVQPAWAQDVLSTGQAALEATSSQTPTAGTSVSAGNPAEGPAKALGTVNQNVIKPSIQMVLVSVLLNSFQFLLDRLAYEAAVAIASLGAGETPLIVQKEGQDLWADIGMDVAGEFVGGLSDMSTDFVGFNLCAPPNPLVRMSIQLGIKQAYQPPEPKCDILKVGQNWEGFINSAIQLSDNPGDAIIEEFAKSLKPGRNELSASVEIMLEAEHRIDLAKATGFQQALAGDGFKSVTDFVTGQVTTPSSVLQKQFEKTTIEDRDKAAAFHMQTLITNPDYLWAMLFNTMSIFTNTLLSESLNRIYTGMFEASPEIDPFNVEYISNNNRQSAIDRFSSYSSTQPTSITNYNIIAEFVTCPSGGVAIPNINNCVMDANFATAVSRAASKNPMTVQEAIDEGLLHGDWPLVSPDDRTKNENSLCYTFGYCYGNLVKLRKARIIPVGWELAAKRSQQGAPATLQEVVDGFDHCNSQGTIDSSSNRFCHLIDPNWVLKYPETQCRAFVSGEQIISGYSSGRANTCVDMPSCISENNDGSCDGGFGYCVREKNIWRFRGDECPVQYASCLKFTNADTKSQKSLLVNTVDFGVCGQGNAGCLWYRTNKYIDDKGNTDPSDDTYEFLPAGVSYMTVARDAAVEYAGSTRTFDYYAHEDRIYFDRDAEECASQDAGCTKLYKIADNLVLNAVANGSFEQDENNDGVPDGWIGLEATDRESDTDEVQTGEYALHIHNEPNVFSQSGIQLAPNTFYTFSLYAKQGSAGATAANAKIRIYDAFGGLIDLTGLSTTCTVQSNYFRLELLNLNNDYSRYECSFTTPGTTAAASLEIDPFNRARFDAIQIEKGAVASNFADGYNREGATAYLKLAPDYLGCEGKATDPQACEQYTQVCTEQEVGCNLYTPKGGGPAIPAIISAVDACPAECVGYAAFKQEATKYELAFFPEYFIADTAASCTAEQVGCDSFTNLDALDQGGEGIEYYSDLRACLTPADAGDNTGADRAANYFTWEGTDQAGYQLRSWWLLQSNLSDAPCSNWTMSGASSLICNDSGSGLAACDSHDDLVNNPDCREFFDENGVRHYREYSKTVTISEDCHPYRKTIALRDDCLASDGYYTPAGECRYFGVPVESQSCSASAVGCRSYTGGAARNQSVVFDDNLESGTVANYMTENGINIAFSNESLAPDGHSLRVYNASGTEFIATTQAIMTSECATAGGCANQNSEMNGECVIAQGEIDCGPLRDKIAAGKTFNLEFLAKGNGAIKAALIEHGGADDLHYFGEAQLTGAWRLYTLGPLDTSDLDYIDRTTVLGFQTSGATEFFLDNIRLTQAEDNITLIKDSWVTPAACDQTPNGLSSPQYYLGCQEYSDVTNRPNYLYQFSRLCGEDKVGCEAYYQTYNSQSPYGQVNNARCLNGAAPNGSPVGALTACQFNGRTVCSIAPGTNFCLFNLDQAISRPLPAKIVLGPEAKLVSGDRPVYLIDDGSTSCSAANVGCTEIGQPTFNRDKTQVTGFESAYFMNNPDEYENTLCAHKALFCAEWSSTKDGNFYFKDPLDQTCEYKTGITIDRREFFGWFRKGSNEPCDWNDLNQDGAYHPADDSALIKEGGKFEVWRNGDSQYSGWVAQCDQNMDLCTEFLDPTDSQEGRNPLGTSYYFKNNDALSESSLAATQRCDGLVSQKQGCVLFHNSSISDMYYSAEPSYIASERADILFGDAQFAKVDPIDCTNYDPNENRLGKNLCELRCAYRTGGLANPLKTLATTASTADANLLYSGACVDNSDCPSQVAANGLTYAGNCVSVEPAARFTNNTNAIVKVVRDRACAQWLTCESKSVTFDDQQQKWVEVCENLELCSRYTREGDTTECTAADQPEPYVLDALYYAARDVTWTGVEYSGYSIPDQLPVDLYDQVDLNPSKWCVSTASGRPYRDEQTDLGVPCTSDDGCDYLAAAGDYYCSPANEQYYVLANVAGPCTEDYNTACTVGFCEDHPNIACGNSSHCPDNGEICVVGYCQDVYLAIGCDTNTQCNGVSGGRNICDPVARKCVNQLTTGENATACRSAGDCTGINPTCTPSALSRVGTCFNQQCLLDIKGQPYSAKQDKVINPECRGYPEIDSPFSGIPGTEVTKYTTKPPPT